MQNGVEPQIVTPAKADKTFDYYAPFSRTIICHFLFNKYLRILGYFFCISRNYVRKFLAVIIVITFQHTVRDVVVYRKIPSYTAHCRTLTRSIRDTNLTIILTYNSSDFAMNTPPVSFFFLSPCLYFSFHILSNLVYTF